MYDIVSNTLNFCLCSLIFFRFSFQCTIWCSWRYSSSSLF